MIHNQFSGFQWDSGNIEKCQKHGVSIAEQENNTLIRPLSARYMHQKQVNTYEKDDSNV